MYKCCVFVLSRLHYRNSLSEGSPKYILSKLQRVQNNAETPFLEHSGPPTSHMILSFHWLPVEQRIEYKSLLCFKVASHQDPIFISELLHHNPPSWQLCFSAEMSSFRAKSSGHQSFSYYRLELSGTNSLFLSVISPLSVQNPSFTVPLP